MSDDEIMEQSENGVDAQGNVNLESQQTSGTSPENIFNQSFDSTSNLTQDDLSQGFLTASQSNNQSSYLDAVYDVPVQVSAVLGKATIPVNQLLKLGRGAVVELDRKVGEAIDIYVNNRLIARGEVVLVEDRLGVTMTEIIKADRM